MPGIFWAYYFLIFLFVGFVVATKTDYSYFYLNRHFRILLGEDCVSALLFKVLNLLVMVTLTAKVKYFLFLYLDIFCVEQDT